MTSKNDLMNFAFVCIEINASFPFPSIINVVALNEVSFEYITVPVNVEYQSRPPSCPACKVFGHPPQKCPKANFKWVPKVQIVAPSLLSTTFASICDGPGPVMATNPALSSGPAPASNEWITLTRGAKPGKSSNPNLGSSNCFSPIANQAGVTPMFDYDSPVVENPLVSKLKVIDEKEGKDLKHK